MTEYAMIVPPEPPIDTRVRDLEGYVWQRDKDGWTATTPPHVCEDWDRLVRDFGPLQELS